MRHVPRNGPRGAPGEPASGAAAIGACPGAAGVKQGSQGLPAALGAVLALAVGLALVIPAACSYDATGDGTGTHCAAGEVPVQDPRDPAWVYCVPRIAVAAASPDGGTADH